MTPGWNRKSIDPRMIPQKKNKNTTVALPPHPMKDPFKYIQIQDLNKIATLIRWLTLPCPLSNQRNMGGDFNPCLLSVEDYDTFRKGVPPVKEIKYGNFGPQRDQALYTCSRFDFNHKTA